MRKKIFLAAATLVLAFALTACGEKDDKESPATTSAKTEAATEKATEETVTTEAKAETEAATEEAETTEAAEAAPTDGQNPFMNFIGIYYCDRASIQIDCKNSDEAQFTIHWSSSAFEHSEWTMTGKFNDSLTIEYSDGEKRTIVYTEDGELESETVDYEDGTGSFTFSGSDLIWKDNKEGVADDMTFSFGPVTEMPDEAGE